MATERLTFLGRSLGRVMLLGNISTRHADVWPDAAQICSSFRGIILLPPLRHRCRSQAEPPDILTSVCVCVSSQGHNQLVAYSRAAYFCVFCAVIWVLEQLLRRKDLPVSSLYGVTIACHDVLRFLRDLLVGTDKHAGRDSPSAAVTRHLLYFFPCALFI